MTGTVSSIRIAARSGFCYGVREAIDAAMLAGREGPTATLGAIVHNEGANERLRAAGVGRIEAIDEAPDGSTVVIRAHGTTPAVRAAAAVRRTRSSSSRARSGWTSAIFVRKAPAIVASSA